MSVSNLIKPTSQGPPSWANLNVKSIKADTITSGDISATSVHGIPIANTAPGDGNILAYSLGNNQLEYTASAPAGPISQSGEITGIVQDTNPKVSSIVFPSPFATVPRVMCNIFDANYETENITAIVKNKTVNGCDVSVFLDNAAIGDNVIEDGTGVVNSSVSQIVLSNNQPAVEYISLDAIDRVKFARNLKATGAGNWDIKDFYIGGGGVPSTSIIKLNLGDLGRFVGRDAPSAGFIWQHNPDKEGEGNWSQTTIDATAAGGGLYKHDSALVISNPAACWATSTFKYSRNTFADGSGTWTVYQIVADTVFSPSLLYIESTQRPAAMYLQGTDFKLSLSSAHDGSGTWTPNTINTSPISGSCAGGVIFGKPCCTFKEGNHLKFVVSTAVDGSGPWTAHNVYDMSTGTETFSSVWKQQSFIEYNGGVAIAWKASNSSELRLSTNPQPDGSGVWTTRVLRSGLDLAADECIDVKLLTTGSLGISYKAAVGGNAIIHYFITEVELDYSIDYFATE